MASQFRVLVSDSVDVAGLEILKSVAHVDVKTKLSEDQLCEIIGDYDALVVRSGTKVTEKIIGCSRKLKIIGRAGVGVDNVNVPAATGKGIFVVNSPQGNTIAAAEHTLGLMFALSRHISAADASMRAGNWEREKFMGGQLQHKTLGIVGLGQVGSHVARVAREMGMDLLVYDPYVNEVKAESLGCRITELDDLLRESDVITLHVPLVASTKHLLNEEKLKLMKSTALVVNCSRGGVVDEVALCNALNSGLLGGAALDVFEVEGKVDKASLLLHTPHLLLTPHLGASTREAQVNVAVDVAQQIKQTFLGNLPESAVNIPGLRAVELSHLRPLIECCEMLGKVAMQLLDGPLEQISITAEGEFGAVDKVEALLLAAANGAIGVHTATRVNFVNVKQVAETHRIKMVVAKDTQNPKNGVSVEVKGGNHSCKVRGTVTEDGDVLLKAFDDVPVYMILPTSTTLLKDSNSPRRVDNENGMESIPTVQFIYSKHHDIPGVLAEITAALGSASLNIANCHLGRARYGSAENNCSSTALAIFHIDGDVPSEVPHRLKLIAAVSECKVFTV